MQQTAYNFNGTPIEEQFYDLARLLLDIIGEGEFHDVEDFKMPEEIILETAFSLQTGYYNNDFERDENGMLYYSGMTEDYCGLYDKEFAKHMTPQQRKAHFMETLEDFEY